MLHSLLRRLLLAVVFCWLSCPAPALAQAAAEKDFSQELPRIPPVEPAAALATFKLQPGFKIEQVAAEPLVASPVAIAFDENGRLYVVEMRDYSEQADEFLGTVRLLEDTDGDGRFDKATVFADKLSWPTAIACWDGGVFVGAAPDIIYLKDTDGDGKADVRRTVFTGFGRTNVQGLMNSFTWTLDNRIEGATSSSGANVRRPDVPNAQPLSLRGRDFRFDPRTLAIEPTSGGAQHGMSFDDWGHKFVCSNSDHIQQVMFEDRYVARNPYLAAPGARVSIATDGPQAEVYRSSPVEPWRIVRTRLRVSGAVPGAVEGGGRAAGYFTGATGVTIYRGTALPEDQRGIAVVGDVGSNLLHRKRLVLDGLQFKASRIDKESELVASTDIWFRPAQFANAPDGALYIIDVYREVIEHPASLPPMIKKHLDLTSGRDRGRIYRVLPAEGFQQPPLPRLGTATAAELVATLAHPNAWHRETAARLLYQRQDAAARAPLEKLAAESPSPLGRMHALYALAGMDALSVNTITRALGDSHAGVRRHAVRLSEPLLAGKGPRTLSSTMLEGHLVRMFDDGDPQVRYQLAFTLGQVPRNSLAVGALARLALRDAENPWMRLAIQSSLAHGAGELLGGLAADTNFRRTTGGQTFMVSLARQIGLSTKAKDGDVELHTLLRTMDQLSQEGALASSLVRALSEGLIRQGRSPDKVLPPESAILRNLIAGAQKIAADDMQPLKKRIDAVESLALASFPHVSGVLSGLLDPRQPQELQTAAITTLSRMQDPAIGPLLLKAWPTLSPSLRRLAGEALLARPERVVDLLDAIQRGTFPPGELEPAQIQALTSHPDKQLRELAGRLLKDVKLGRRQDVVAAYRSVLDMTGDRERGKVTFQKICAACHRVEGVGHETGPNLATIKNRGAETILLNVLDPSREVNPQYVNYLLITDDGRTLSGMLAAETATSVTLRRAEAASDTVLRINIEELRSTGLSLMPEGLEKQLDQQALADVIAYLMGLQ